MIEQGKSVWTPGCGCFLLALLLPIALVAFSFLLLALFDREVGFLGAGIAIGVMVFAILIVLAAPLLGVVWAPFAAWLCGRSARARGLDSRKFAVAGAIYSALLFWPSIYLLLRIRGKRVSGRAVHAVYFLLYGMVWPASCVAVMFATLGTPRWFVMLGLSLGLCNAVTWFVSHRRLARWHGRRRIPQADGMDEILPDRAYLTPFALTLGWVLLAVAAWALNMFAEDLGIWGPPPRRF